MTNISNNYTNDNAVLVFNNLLSLTSDSIQFFGLNSLNMMKSVRFSAMNRGDIALNW